MSQKNPHSNSFLRGSNSELLKFISNHSSIIGIAHTLQWILRVIGSIIGMLAAAVVVVFVIAIAVVIVVVERGVEENRWGSFVKVL